MPDHPYIHTGTIISDGADQPVDADGLKCALRRMSGGVIVITAGKGEDRTGATVTSATALSIEPPAWSFPSTVPPPHVLRLRDSAIFA